MEENEFQASWCVLVHPRSQPPKPRAIELLAAHAPLIDPRDEAFSAMARVCLLARGPGSGSLVILDPRLVARSSELIATLAAYFPQVRCLQMDSQTLVLGPVSESIPPEWMARPSKADKSVMQGRSLADRPAAGSAKSDSARMDPPSSQLTDEELNLLLAHDEGAEPGNGPVDGRSNV